MAVAFLRRWRNEYLLTYLLSKMFRRWKQPKQDTVGDGIFRPVPPPCELDETRVVFDSGPFAPLCENMTSATKPEQHCLSFPFRGELDLETRH